MEELKQELTPDEEVYNERQKEVIAKLEEHFDNLREVLIETIKAVERMKEVLPNHEEGEKGREALEAEIAVYNKEIENLRFMISNTEKNIKNFEARIIGSSSDNSNSEPPPTIH